MIKNNKGVTLVENMVSILVFLIGIEALMASCFQGVAMAKRADYSYVAYNLAKNHLERMKLYSFANLSSSNETATPLNSDGDVDTSGSFSRTTVITPAYLGNASLTQATVTVRYIINGVQNSSQCALSYIFTSVS